MLPNKDNFSLMKTGYWWCLRACDINICQINWSLFPYFKNSIFKNNYNKQDCLLSDRNVSSLNVKRHSRRQTHACMHSNILVIVTVVQNSYFVLLIIITWRNIFYSLGTRYQCIIAIPVFRCIGLRAVDWAVGWSPNA